MDVEPALWDDPDILRLTAAQQEELRARYDGQGEPGTAPSAADVALVVVARDDDGTPMGCGALRALGNGVAELKRMYVVPEFRGRGVATAVLDGLEAAARVRGWTTLRLETGPRQPEAIGLYRRAGYRQIPAFGDYRSAPGAGHSLFFERVLDRAGPSAAAPV